MFDNVYNCGACFEAAKKGALAQRCKNPNCMTQRLNDGTKSGTVINIFNVSPITVCARARAGVSACMRREYGLIALPDSVIISAILQSLTQTRMLSGLVNGLTSRRMGSLFKYDLGGHLKTSPEVTLTKNGLLSLFDDIRSSIILWGRTMPGAGGAPISVNTNMESFMGNPLSEVIVPEANEYRV